MSTPYKSRASKTPLHDAQTIRRYLKVDLNDRLYHPIFWEEFVTIVWGLDRTVMDTILTSGIMHSTTDLALYRKVLDTPGSYESEFHKPFRAIASHLLNAVYTKLSKDPDTLSTDFWDREGLVKVLSEFTNLQPDLLPVWKPLPDTMEWRLVKAPLEFKKPSIPKGGMLPTIMEAGNASTTPGTSQSSPASSGIVKQPKKSKKSPRNSSDTSPATSVDTTGLPSGQKRSRDSDGTGRDGKRSKRAHLTGDEVQLASYVLECFAGLNHSFVSGILVEGLKITLWYFDRVAVVRSRTFQLDERPQDLALVLYALDQADMAHCGFDTNIYRFSIPSDPKAPIVEACLVPLERPPAREEVVCFHFPHKADTLDYVFQIKDVLYKYRGLVGRGTFVAAVKAYLMNQCLYRDHCVLKLSWQYTGRTSEGDILTTLRQAIPAWQKHLPNPIIHQTFTAAETGLPRLEMTLETAEGRTAPKERDLHVLLSDEYQKLWKARDVVEFKQIFLDCLECHYHAYMTGRVLHRDISENNLMIYHSPSIVKRSTDENDTTFQPGQGGDAIIRSIGILNDFDMAEAVKVDEKGQAQTSNASHRTGTLPFMAIDLVGSNKANPIAHAYRHDLESFFYVLVWAAVHYDLKHGERRVATPSYLQSWLRDKEALAAKQAFMFTGLTENSAIYRGLTDDFKDLWDEWIVPLHSLFRKAFYYEQDQKTDRVAYDYATIDDTNLQQITSNAARPQPKPLHSAFIGETLRQAIPAWREHLPNPIFHQMFTAAEIGLPRLEMTLETAEGRTTLKERDLHVLLSDQYQRLWEVGDIEEFKQVFLDCLEYQYQRLWEVGDIEEFKQVFLDCLECHYHAYTTGRVLHRDISENNLMVSILSNVKAPTNEERKNTSPISGSTQAGSSTVVPRKVGILNDFDMAAKVDNNGQVLVSSASHRTGTLPFMAVDLLKPSTPVIHVYRHDLESFFYVLVWASVHYDLEHGKRKYHTPKELQAWLDDGKARDSKGSFYFDSLSSQDSILKHVSDEVKEKVWDVWVVPLHRLFKNAFHHRSIQEDEHLPCDHETLGGKITFETFMAAIGVRPRGLDGLKQGTSDM
ncbi:hypothetical protein CVT26_006569 [Gymnopilus dilepis]|uniref:Protein kinase domain-containing protein n=1 Tax=Gymnopilus dilepis TaxID=231916 RepID=A0A409Y2U7_9AGAR|nr:hypothetical protein CVT26_006569 [Gymnopilus dilepis]